MTTQEFFIRCVIVAITSIVTLVALYNLVVKKLMASMKYNERIPLVELYASINLVINNECDLYERYFANTTDIDFTAMTNSQFMNVYQDLCSRVLHAFSPGFMGLVNVYLNDDEFNTYTARIVYNWLADKVQTIPETAQDMDDEDVAEDGSFYV